MAEKKWQCFSSLSEISDVAANFVRQRQWCIQKILHVAVLRYYREQSCLSSVTFVALCLHTVQAKWDTWNDNTRPTRRVDHRFTVASVTGVITGDNSSVIFLQNRALQTLQELQISFNRCSCRRVYFKWSNALEWFCWWWIVQHWCRLLESVIKRMRMQGRSQGGGDLCHRNVCLPHRCTVLKQR